LQPCLWKQRKQYFCIPRPDLFWKWYVEFCFLSLINSKYRSLMSSGLLWELWKSEFYYVAGYTTSCQYILTFLNQQLVNADACNRDLGGPLFTGTGAEAVIHGIISCNPIPRGIGCRASSYPGKYGISWKPLFENN
jgi:hypothetical protein